MNTRLAVKTFNNIAEIDKKKWDGVFPDILESYNFFKTMDESLSHQFNSYYVTVHDGENMVCAAPCIMMDYPLDTTIEGPIKRVILNIRKKFPRFMVVRTFICGSPASEGRIGIKDIRHKEIINLFSEEMMSIAKKERASLVAFKDFNESFCKYLDCLTKKQFYRVPSYPAVELDLNFRSFEEYFSSLSKATRKDLKRKFKKSEGAVKIDFEIRNELGDRLDEAYELYVNTLKKSEVCFEVLSKSFFQMISRNMPQETKYFMWYIDEKLIAFDLCLASNGVLIDEYIGMDYEIAYKYHIYFLTFRDIINWCIKNNIRSYVSGALNYDPKKRLDFKFIPQFIYARHKNMFINMLFGLLLMAIKPGNFEEAVKPVKK